MARRFFYVSLGILALTVAYNLGASSIEAQGGTTVFAGVTERNGLLYAIAQNGDLYGRFANLNCDGTWSGSCGTGDWMYVGNVLGGPVPVDGSTFGAIKGSYK